MKPGPFEPGKRKQKVSLLRPYRSTAREGEILCSLEERTSHQGAHTASKRHRSEVQRPVVAPC
jgi:hypothetical protein